MAVAARSGDYSALFAQLVVRNADILCQQWKAAEDAIALLSHSSQGRSQLQHALQSIIHLPGAWSTAQELLLLMLTPMQQAGHRRDWIPLLEECLRLGQAYDDADTVAEVSYRLGVLHQLLGEYARSETYLRQSAESFTNLDTSRYVRAINALAYGARLNGQSEWAEELVQQALVAAGGEEQHVAVSYTVLGCLAYDRRDWPLAQAFWQRSLDLWQVVGDTGMVAMRLRDLGTVLYEQAQYEESSACFRQALDLSVTDGDIWNVAITRMNLGNVYLLSQQPETARALYRQAEDSFRSLYDYRHLAMCYNNQGIACRDMEDLPAAECAYQAAVEQWQRLGEVVLLVETLNDLGDLYRRQGRYAEALTILDEALLLLGDKDHPNYNYLREIAVGHQAAVHGHMDAQTQMP